MVSTVYIRAHKLSCKKAAPFWSLGLVFVLFFFGFAGIVSSPVWAGTVPADSNRLSATVVLPDREKPAHLAMAARQGGALQSGMVVPADLTQVARMQTQITEQRQAPLITEAPEVALPVKTPVSEPVIVEDKEDKSVVDEGTVENCTPSTPLEAIEARLPTPDISDRRDNPDEGTPAAAQPEPVDLEADTLTHDEQTRTITASGHVELVQGERILRADEVAYHLDTDRVEASGHVVLTEANGDVHFADHVTLSDQMRRGMVQGLRSYLADGGRLYAEEGERTNEGRTIVMRTASYTPCNCGEEEKGELEKGRAPAWQVKAKTVTYDEDENKIAYRDAWFEMFGVPVLYTPYFSHPDGRENQKSGFLTPDLSFDSELGVMVTGRYYWAIAPDRDAVFGVMAGNREAPVALAEYRQRFADASLRMDGSLTRSGWTDSINEQDVWHEEDWRGHLFADGLWDINQEWRAGLDLELSSDDQYLEQYDFTGKDVLENELYLERLAGRNYAAARMLSFQDVRVREEQTDQPNVLPELEAHFVGKPNGLLGGRWDVNLDMLNLYRDGDAPDMTRTTGILGWEKRYVTGFGLVNTLDVSLRGDLYHSSDIALATAGSGRSREAEKARWFTQAHLVSSYPLVKPMESGQLVIEPLAALTIAPNINSDDDDIPNEDSQDVQLDASNLFSANRFPGMDRIEDQSRVTYGMRGGWHTNEGGRLELFAGQSHRFNEDDNPFPDGSGLSRQESDIVGSVLASYNGHAGLDYRFQVETDQMDAQRHELDAFAIYGPVRADTRYLFAQALEGTDITENREQLMGALAVDVTDHWRLRGGALYDLGEDVGLRKALAGIDYTGCCMALSVAAERSLTRDSSGDSGTSVMVRLGLKHIGSFQTASQNRREWRAGNSP